MQFKTTYIRKNNKDLIIFLPPKAKIDYLFALKRKIPETFGIIEFQYPKEILTPNAIETKNNFLDFLKHVTDELKKLNKKKKRNLYFIGHSLGGLFGMIIADKIDVKKMVLLVPGYNLAQAFWKSKSKQTIYCREEMKKNGMTLKKLKELWGPISPDSYFHKKAFKSEYYIKLSKKDKVIPYSNGLKLIKELEKKKTHLILKTSYLPHTLTVVFYTLFPKEIIRFLKK